MPRISQIAMAKLQMSAEYKRGASGSNRASSGYIANVFTAVSFQIWGECLTKTTQDYVRVR
ncbi:hypothetical protein N7491_001461 [Penicillium cf. griseofulvum]|uniref:Uncharacterized protein n=1 Tax=Penicillium cf. griseofulvum TaxID=2972120 RepID=A0A9W9M8V7_9EURO|nr:hypothetical protein N7472_006592 [Penicillium cf. griseofulvum]KAJ5445379.1 hypothetical protein N7491_001461 [Penicillium cf. griseofulvum]KAJ5447098.1 hypothetical protein N7445_001919 [Penicillium cf. griseofulvum]